MDSAVKWSLEFLGASISFKSHFPEVKSTPVCLGVKKRNAGVLQEEKRRKSKIMLQISLFFFMNDKLIRSKVGKEIPIKKSQIPSFKLEFGIFY
ncbi:hypothetical protein [Flavobacterium sp. ASV13]|uniref:hypothetical protein n=1 Tax=Flavobacterium sp. ASV13 TaxID=1506583 RepID=UPI0005532FBF|nr:hypothetical protein [Flavobacterium sp. ASV13]